MILQKKGIEISNESLLDFIEFINGDDFVDKNENYAENNAEWQKNREENQKRVVKSLNERYVGWFVFPFCIVENLYDVERIEKNTLEDKDKKMRGKLVKGIFVFL